MRAATNFYEKKREKNAFYKNLFYIVILYPLNGCSQNRRFAAEKVSSVAAKRERARRFRDARAFSGIAAAAARKRMSGVDGMEMSVRATQEAKHTADRDGNQRGRRIGRGEGIGEGGRESGESAETEEEEHERRKAGTAREARRGRHYNERQRRASGNRAQEPRAPGLRRGRSARGASARSGL